MKTSKLFGICIVFALAFASVNAEMFNSTLLDVLLSNYDMGYDDGTFSVSYVNHQFSLTGGRNVLMNFAVEGTGTYDIKAIISSSSGNYTNAYITDMQTGAVPGTITFDMDGNYVRCRDNPMDSGVYGKDYDAEIMIFQSGMQVYDKHVQFRANCSSRPIFTSAFNLIGQNTQGGPEIDVINLTTQYLFSEAGTFTVGSYLTDNKTAYAYAEETVVVPSASYVYVSLFFEADQFKDFNISGEKLLLSKTFINGHELLDQYNSINRVYNTNTFSKSSFEFTGIKIDSYSFDETLTGDKFSSLDADLVISNVNASLVPYDLTVSLENEAGEVVDVQTASITANGVATVTFDGEDIYSSGISGPYRIGFARISESDVVYVYETAKGLTSEYSYTNFTAPPMADVLILNEDLVSDGNDVDVTVRNLGNVDAYGIIITLFDENSTKIDEAIINSITAGNSDSYKFSGANIAKAIVVADFMNLISESNESNNRAASFDVSLPSDIPVYVYGYDMNDYVYNSLTTSIGGNATFDAGSIQVQTGIYYPAEIPAFFNLIVNTQHNLTMETSTYFPMESRFVFDQGLYNCVAGSNCNLGDSYGTNCVWESISWSCSQTVDSQLVYFRLYDGPIRVKISGYLARP